jgi:hypothetical protein
MLHRVKAEVIVYADDRDQAYAADQVTKMLLTAGCKKVHIMESTKRFMTEETGYGVTSVEKPALDVTKMKPERRDPGVAVTIVGEKEKAKV